MTRNERSEYLARHTADLMRAVWRRNSEAAFHAMRAIDERYGAEGIFNTCRVVADATRRVIYPGIERGDGSLSGAFLTIQRRPETNYAPQHVWAAQFFAAHVNGDDETVGALFLASIDDPKTHANQVVALMNMCAGLIRDASGE